MAFKKDGETKVFVSKPQKGKTASKNSKVRYTVDDLVKDSESTSATKTAEEKEEDEDVSDQT